MAVNDKIIKLAANIFGLILPGGKLLVVENGYVSSLGLVPDEKYFVPSFELLDLPPDTQKIFNGVMISHGMDSPFLTSISSAGMKPGIRRNHLQEL